MSNIRRSDVKNHLSPRFRTKTHLSEPVSQPDATGFSGIELETVKATRSNFDADFIAEHSSGVAVAPAEPVTGSIRPQAPTVSKSARA
jgi:hypothetical protein